MGREIESEEEINMGCDIHLHIELKINGKWEHFASPRIDRDYNLFEKMAGVRGLEQNAIVSPRGLPNDISTVTKIDVDRWGSDGHSHSWFGVDEIEELSGWKKVGDPLDLEYKILRTWLFGNSFSGFKKYRAEYPKEINDIRFVFWFDS